MKERLGELHRDVALLRRANTPPLGTRYEHVARDCRVLEQQLEHQQIELERLKNVFDVFWDEQLCRIRVEQEIFHSQVFLLDASVRLKFHLVKINSLKFHFVQQKILTIKLIFQ